MRYTLATPKHLIDMGFKQQSSGDLTMHIHGNKQLKFCVRDGKLAEGGIEQYNVDTEDVYNSFDFDEERYYVESIELLISVIDLN